MVSPITFFENGKQKTALTLQNIKRPAGMNGFSWDSSRSADQKLIFEDSFHGPYKKGDILWLLPLTYDTQTTPPEGVGAGQAAYPLTVPAAEAFMGISRPYSKQTAFRQYAVRLRASIDNPRNPNIVGAVGTDWAVDDPAAIAEEGSNSNGSYVIFASSYVKQIASKQHTGMAANTYHQVFVEYPIGMATVTKIDPPIYKGGNVMSGHLDTIAQNYLLATGATTSAIPHVAIASAGLINGAAIVTAYGTI